MNISKFLKDNVRPATGCTEPIAVAYATSLAYWILYNPKYDSNPNEDLSFNYHPDPFEMENLVSLVIETDRNVYKNSYAIMIPGARGKKGMKLASAMAFFCDPTLKLNIFHDVDELMVQKAQEILKQGKIEAKEQDNTSHKPRLDILIDLCYKIQGKIHESRIHLQDDHAYVTLIELNNHILFRGKEKNESKNVFNEVPESISQIVELANHLNEEDEIFLIQGVDMNNKIALEGLKGKYGMGIGKSLLGFKKYEMDTENVIIKSKILAAAASDARMGGSSLPVMSTSGSGNQGIIATLPLAIIAEKKNISKKHLAKSLFISHAITALSEKYSGHLSALCGTDIKSGMGLTAATTYLLGGNLKQINDSINLMAANTTGVLCDGAKEGCALKVYKAVGTALESAFMAIEGIKVPADNGIVHERAEDTLKAIGKISYSMDETDKELLSIIRAKNR